MVRGGDKSHDGVDEKVYDIVLFGVTGFTGKLAAEYLLRRYPHLDHGSGDEKNKGKVVKWAACARNEEKARGVLREIILSIQGREASGGESISPSDEGREDESAAAAAGVDLPPVLVADVSCSTAEEEAVLEGIVRQTKVVLTCVGPFERYGKTLAKLCSEHGVHYADITGETDFVRDTISQHDSTARASGAVLVSHCGNDCIPQDLTVYEMHRYASDRGCTLRSCRTYAQFPPDASWSGGTVATATHELGKDRSTNTAERPSYDPLLNENGSRSDFTTKNCSPKTVMEVSTLGRRRQGDGDGATPSKVGPWIMAPVMVNCVRRSNALLHYHKEFQYGDAVVKDDSLMGWIKETANGALFLAAMKLPSVFGRFLPQPGEGPSREAMESGYLVLHGRGEMVKGVDRDEEGAGDRKQEQEDVRVIKLATTFRFNKDIGYLYTAALLVEAGMLLLEKAQSRQDKAEGGCLTPAAAFGSALTDRITERLDATWEIKEEEEAAPDEK